MNEKKSSLTPADRQQIAKDFTAAVSGRMDQSLTAEATKSLSATTSAYPAHGSIASLILYEKVQVVVDNGKTFDGNAWGVATPGGGALFGNVYTDDINALYSKTETFMIIGTPVYLTVIFFDKDHHALGSFQAGGISTVTGTGGGKGGWS